MRLILRLARGLARLAVALLVAFLLLAAVIGTHALYLARLAPPPAPAAAIVVLGGGVFADGRPGPDTLARTRHGIALYEAGLAPRIHFTGGHRNPHIAGLGDGMAAVAREAGVPPAAISTENASRSTLQNALFSREALPPAGSEPLLVVSDGYHLARAWASFRWAGYDDVHVSAVTALGGGSIVARARRVARETLAWGFNVGRLAIWVGLNAAGYHRPETSDLLALEPGAAGPA
jgi:uncharacterized SAM-binding protein YcdF (DUF218 family)